MFSTKDREYCLNCINMLAIFKGVHKTGEVQWKPLLLYCSTNFCRSVDERIQCGVSVQGQVRDSRGRLPPSQLLGACSTSLPSTTDRWWLPYNHTLPIRLKQFVVNRYFHKALCKQHSCASLEYPWEVARVTRTEGSSVVKSEEPHGKTGRRCLAHLDSELDVNPKRTN